MCLTLDSGAEQDRKTDICRREISTDRCHVHAVDR
jgi:hypothetical protein